METVIDGRWKGRAGARLHLAPEGMTLVDESGAVIGTTGYAEVADVTTARPGRRVLLRVDLGDRGAWELGGLHALQARFAAELIREQLAVVRRRALPLYTHPEPLGSLGDAALSLLQTSSRGVVEFLDYLLCQAALHGASDLHLEPFPSELRARLRLDGSLVDAARVPVLWLPRVLARLKILADLAIYRSDVPQEGRFALRLADRTVDVRATLLPTLHGEKAVLRLFDPARTLLGLDQLGMPEATRGAWETLLQQPQGLLLLTGPSNHGKTTTMYASLQFLHEHRRDLANLCTVEDPVEHDLRAVNQTQVNPAVGLTFARGLRTVLRQDPEVIMLGEIRDEETAEIAVRAGLTGHLILSTVHAPSAAGAFARLVDLKCPPFLVASAVSGVLAQRLLRKVCAACAGPDAPAPALLERLGLRPDAGGWRRGAGCDACGFTGYRGRTGVFHLLEVTEAVREGVLAGSTTGELERRGDAAAGLQRAALAAAAAGTTSLEEVLRVLGGAPGPRREKTPW